MIMANFLTTQVNEVINTLGSNFNVCLNKVGNIDIKFIGRPNPHNVHYVFNPQPNGKIIIRRHNDNYSFSRCKSVHPLGTKWKNRKIIDGGYKNGGWEKKELDWDNTGFKTFDEAVNYFVGYTKKFNKHLAQ